MLVAERGVRVVRWAGVLVVDLQWWPAKFLELCSTDAAALALVAICLKPLFPLSSPAFAEVVAGRRGHGQPLEG